MLEAGVNAYTRMDLAGDLNVMPRTVTFDRQGLAQAGFEGFVTVTSLLGRTTRDIPQKPGVYAVVREAEAPPRFLRSSPAGWFKGVDPTVDTAILRARWLAATPVLYLGKATAGGTGRRNLSKRITELIEFGTGRPVGHRGGRYLWQVAGSSRFVVAWRTDDLPTAAENALLRDFEVQYGQLPFANIAGPRGGD